MQKMKAIIHSESNKWLNQTINMDHCESFPIVGLSLIISIIKWKMGMGECTSEEKEEEKSFER